MSRAATVTISHPTGYVKEAATLTSAKGVAEFPVLRATGQTTVGYTINVVFPGFAPIHFRAANSISPKGTSQANGPKLLRPEVSKKSLHALTFELKHAVCVSRLKEFESQFIVQREAIDIDFPVPVRLDESQRVFDDG